MKVKRFVFNPFQENTFVLYDESKECVIIDPGCYEKAEEEELENFISENGLKPVALLNTHCHIDHILGNQFVAEKWGVDLQMHKDDLPLLENAEQVSNMYGLQNYNGSPFPKHFLKDGDNFSFGESKLDVIFTPGHAPGHICFYSEQDYFIISGDVIFQMSIGRTDLPFGDYDTLINSITEKIFPLPGQTQIHCGHGPSTVLNYEREHNPFLQ
jgi:glyoxylase-like metal-dependent hydrolase (beta-lactamase superfamily II)